MKHNLKRVLRLTEDRAPWVRAVRAWRALLPDWTPSLDAVKELDLRPHEHGTAVRIVADGWTPNDPRWDVLMALLEWERREAKEQARREHWVKPGAFERLMDAVRDEQDTPCEDEPVMDACPCGQCADTGCHHDPCLMKPNAAVIPISVVQNGRVVSESETTVETPLKAFFLDNVVSIRHLSEKQGGDA